MVFETFIITVAINQLNFIPSKFPVLLYFSEMQTLQGEPEQVVQKKDWLSFQHVEQH